jgi:hypothetical protein
MENQKVMSSTTKGIILALIQIVLSVIMQLLITDFAKMQQFSWISYIIIIGGLIWAALSYSKEMNANVTFGNLFAHGFKTTAVMTILVLAYTILSVTILFPEMKDKAMEVARTQMESDGKLSEAQIDQAIGMTQKFFIPFAIGGVVIGYLILGAIGSLIGAAIAKKNPQPANFQ